MYIDIIKHKIKHNFKTTITQLHVFIYYPLRNDDGSYFHDWSYQPIMIPFMHIRSFILISISFYIPILISYTIHIKWHRQYTHSAY